MWSLQEDFCETGGRSSTYEICVSRPREEASFLWGMRKTLLTSWRRSTASTNWRLRWKHVRPQAGQERITIFCNLALCSLAFRNPDLSYCTEFRSLSGCQGLLSLFISTRHHDAHGIFITFVLIKDLLHKWSKQIEFKIHNSRAIIVRHYIKKVLLFDVVHVIDRKQAVVY